MSYTVTDTAYLSFSQTISLTAGMESIKLQAAYDSYLLLFDKNNINDITLDRTRPRCFNSTDEVFYAFISRNSSSSYPVTISRPDGDKSYLYLDKLRGEKGKYYYFKDIEYGYDLPDMEPGI